MFAPLSVPLSHYLDCNAKIKICTLSASDIFIQSLIHLTQHIIKLINQSCNYSKALLQLIRRWHGKAMNVS